MTTDFLPAGAVPPSTWAANSPDVGLISFGYNEVVSDTQFETDTNNLIAEMTSRSITPLLVTQPKPDYPDHYTTDRSARINELNAVYRDIAGGGVAIADVDVQLDAEYVAGRWDHFIRNWASFGGTVDDPDYHGPESPLDAAHVGDGAAWFTDIHPNQSGSANWAKTIHPAIEAIP